MGHRSRFLLFVFAIICFVLTSSTPIHASKNRAAASAIWESSSEEVELLYFGDSGLFWQGEDEETIYRYDGSRVEEIEDFEGYELSKVERDGITVWNESLTEEWEEFRLYVKVDGKKKALEMNMNFPAERIEIRYPYITWEVRCNSNSLCGERTYNLESEELTEKKSYRLDYDGVYKQEKNGLWKFIRPFEESSVSDYEYSGWALSEQNLLWMEPSGLYLHDTRENMLSFKRLSQEPGDFEFVVNSRYAFWVDRSDEWRVYDIAEDKIYPTWVDSDDVMNILIHDGTMAVLSSDEDRYWIEMHDVQDWVKKAKTEHEGESPDVLKPEYASGVIARLSHEEPDHILVSPRYVVWLDYQMHFQRIGQPQKYYLEGHWEDAVFVGDDLYALRLYEGDEDERDAGLIRVDLETGEQQIIRSFTWDDMPEKLVSDDSYVYWHDEDTGDTMRYSSKNENIETINTGTAELEAWYAAGGQVVWIEEDDDGKYVLKQLVGDNEVKTLTQWAAQSSSVDEITFDGKYIAWRMKSYKNQLSEIHLYEVETKKKRLVHKEKMKGEDSHLQLQDGMLYFINGSDQLVMYNINKKKKSTIANQVNSFTVQGNELFYTRESPASEENYVLYKRLADKYAVDIQYKWDELSNNERLWNNIRFSFFPDDIELVVGKKTYQWSDFYHDPDDWEDFLEENEDELVIRVRF